MRGFGVLLLILGVGSLVLPKFDVQFTLMSKLEPYQPWAGIGVGVVGLLLLLAGKKKPAAAK